jgi:hypothetical protein
VGPDELGIAGMADPDAECATPGMDYFPADFFFVLLPAGLSAFLTGFFIGMG